jgi:hypothetical protein
MLTRTLIILFISLHCTSQMMAQDVPGARAAGMAGCALLLDDGWSVWHNQAGLAQVRGLQAGAYYQSRFAISELADRGAFVAHPLGIGTIALSYTGFGYSAFTSDRTALSYAMRLSERFRAGIQFNYHSIRIAEGYGSQRALSVEAGFQYKLNEKLSLAAHIANPTRAKLAPFNDERLPTTLRASAGYSFSKKVMLLGELRMVNDQRVQIRGAIEYHVTDQFTLRCGAGTAPTSTAFGFGWRFKSFRADVATSYHSILGFSPQIGIAYITDKQP